MPKVTQQDSGKAMSSPATHLGPVQGHLWFQEPSILSASESSMNSLPAHSPSPGQEAVTWEVGGQRREVKQAHLQGPERTQGWATCCASPAPPRLSGCLLALASGRLCRLSPWPSFLHPRGDTALPQDIHVASGDLEMGQATSQHNGQRETSLSSSLGSDPA